MTRPDRTVLTDPSVHAGYEPRRGWLIAGGIFVAAALTLCWPMLAGQLINGSDYYLAGWGFRHFGAALVRANGMRRDGVGALWVTEFATPR